MISLKRMPGQPVTSKYSSMATNVNRFSETIKRNCVSPMHLYCRSINSLRPGILLFKHGELCEYRHAATDNNIPPSEIPHCAKIIPIKIANCPGVTHARSLVLNLRGSFPLGDERIRGFEAYKEPPSISAQFHRRICYSKV